MPRVMIVKNNCPQINKKSSIGSISYPKETVLPATIFPLDYKNYFINVAYYETNNKHWCYEIDSMLWDPD